MKRHQLLLLLLTFLAPLLMSNSPSPYPHATTYEDYDVTPLTVTQDGSYYLYEATITNIGDGYIDISRSYLDIEHTYIPHAHPRHDIVIPGASYQMVFPGRKLYDLNSFTYRINAFIDVVEKTTFTNVRDLEKKLYEGNAHEYWGAYYNYNFDADYERNDEYYQELIVSYLYEGEVYTQYMRPSGETRIYFDEVNDLTLEELTFIDFYTVRGRKRGSGLNAMYLLLAFGTVILIVAVIPLVIALPIGITFLTIYLVKKKRARKKEAEQES